MRKTWIIGAVLAIALGACEGKADLTGNASAGSDGVGVSADASGSVTVSGDGQALCVALYSLETLRDREFAFDGTVKAVSGGDVTFEVHEWFKGGSGGEVTLDGSSVTGISSVSEISADVGVRLLVAGDDTFAWACGFTQAYSAEVASEWRATLS